MASARARWQVVGRREHPHNKSQVSSVTVAVAHSGHSWEIEIPLSPSVNVDMLEKAVLAEFPKILEALKNIAL